MKEISLKDLLEAGCHFGHQTTRWNPKMKPYIFTARDRIHIFDLVKTKEGLTRAVAFAKTIASEGGQIIFVGTKRQAQEIVRQSAQKVNMPYITERWIGGLITNWDQIKKRLDFLADLKSGKASGRFKERTKKENLLIDREIVKLERIFGGIANLTGLPKAIFVADAKKDSGALTEARKRGIKSIAIVDTNANPDLADFVIPANDDATKSIQLIVDVIAEAVEEEQKKLKVQSSKLKVGEEKVEKEGEEVEKKRKAKSVERKTTAKNAKRVKKQAKEKK